MKTVKKYSKKSLKVKQKVKKDGLLGLFCESKKSKKSVGKKSIFSIFRKIDLIDFFDSIDSPNGGDTEEGGLLTSDAFSEASIRRGFMGKVYSILSLQLAITSAFIEPVKLYARQNPWLMWIAFIPILICMIIFACCHEV